MGLFVWNLNCLQNAHLQKIKSDIEILVKLAKKLGITTKKLTKKEAEDFALGLAMEAEKTNEFVNTKGFKKKLRK